MYMFIHIAYKQDETQQTTRILFQWFEREKYCIVYIVL